MGIIEQYLRYQEEYEEKYGPKTVVLMQIGNFYEIYTYDPEKDVMKPEKHEWPTRKIGHCEDLSVLLNMRMTSEDSKKEYSLKNPNKMGFPCIAYAKHRDVMLSNNYTIVKVDQVKKEGRIERFVAEILSPATIIDNLSGLPASNQITSIYIDVQRDSPKLEEYLLTCGVSSIDVTTGNNMVSELYSSEQDAIKALQDIYRYLLAVRPREILMNVTGVPKDKENVYKDYIHKSLELHNYDNVVIILNNINKDYIKVNYQIQFLSKIFKDHVDNLILEDLGIERLHYGTICYILLLQYCYEHNEQLIEKIRQPDVEWINEDKHLVLTHNAIKQLDILPKPGRTGNRVGKMDSLMSVVNNTRTSMGKRFLMNMLANPITDVKQLRAYHTMIEDTIEWNKDGAISRIENLLKVIPDMERYQRKLQLKLIKPHEFAALFRAYINIVNLYIMIRDSNTSLTSLLFSKVAEYNACLKEVLTRYDLDVLAKTDLSQINDSFFKKGQDATADKYQQELDVTISRIQSIVDHLNGLLSGSRGKLISYSLDDKKSDKLGLFTTKAKSKKIENSQVDEKLCGKLHYINVGKDVMITSDVIADLASSVIKIQKDLRNYLTRCYNTTISQLADKYNFYSQVNDFIRKIDYINSGAKTAIKNNYFKPVVIEPDNAQSTSYLSVKNIRHPIIEKLIDSQYITNDITLGKDPSGMLLYGSNSCGKSSLAKAIGLNLILAQAGLFTAGQIEFQPYTKIITRLSGEDNLIQGKSSFVVEMTELRTILRNADQKTLVLGDELCRGTETTSGTSLTIATITSLVERKTSFIFATHMHHLYTNSYITAIPPEQLKICHLSLHYDDDLENLVYDRKLKDGPGKSIYGLEVARSLSIDSKFIKKAEEIRKSLSGSNKDFLDPNTSKYNSSVYMDSCYMCKRGSKETTLHTHHISEQSLADKNGFIQHFHKNSKFNLITLCEKCHVALHKTGLKLEVKQTPRGNMVKIIK